MKYNKPNIIFNRTKIIDRILYRSLVIFWGTWYLLNPKAKNQNDVLWKLMRPVRWLLVVIILGFIAKWFELFN